MDTVIVHYGEIALKGKNRPFVENTLIRNIKLALTGTDYGSVNKISGRFLVKLNGNSNIEKIMERLGNVFGIEHFSFGYECEQETEDISSKALGFLKNRKFGSFRVDARRSEKTFKLTSREINEKVGESIKNSMKKKVDLTNPDQTVFVEIVGKRAFVYFEKTESILT